MARRRTSLTKRHHKCSTKKHSTRKRKSTKKHDSKKHLKVEVKVHHKY